MPDTGSPFYLPYPALSDEADFPSDDQALAVASHSVMTASAPRIACFKNATQNMPTSNAYYNCTWDVIDQQTSITLDADKTYFTVPVAGLYQINASVYFSGAASSSNLIMDAPPYLGGDQDTHAAWIVLNRTYPCSLELHRTWRFFAGAKFHFIGRSSLANDIMYGSSVRYTTMDCTRIGN